MRKFLTRWSTFLRTINTGVCLVNENSRFLRASFNADPLVAADLLYGTGYSELQSECPGTKIKIGKTYESFSTELFN